MAVVLVLAAITAACTGDDGDRGTSSGSSLGQDGGGTGDDNLGAPVLAARTEPLPTVTPTPQEMRWLGPDVAVPPAVDLIVAEGVDQATADALVTVLEQAGAAAIHRRDADDRPGRDDGLLVTIGSAVDTDVVARLDEVGVAVPADLPPEGYALAAFGRAGGGGEVVVAGADAAGTFYAVQTLRQLAAGATVAAVGVVDRPAMAHRGVIEGFYGSPWTSAERLDLLAFAGRFKLNTFVYAPKDDPYHRERWREPYPADQIEQLRTLVEAATANHVRFTFAVSPGPSVCYSDPADLAALTAKLDAVYALGVRAFSVALDDIDHTRWNCDGDRQRYGAPAADAAARAQVDLLNTVQRDFVATHTGVQPLQFVPTEYRGTGDSPYRTVVRDRLAPGIEVTWTGPMVVPAEITVAQAEAAARVFGRPLLVWDNTPVNDFPPTEGRLILAPYARREPGLSAQVTGIVLNPMNQASASKVQLVGAADFAWNDTAYDPVRAHRAAALHLLGGPGGHPTGPSAPATGEALAALLAFFDVENLAPTSATSGAVSQPQAPVLDQQLDAFRTAWASGDRDGAVDMLRPYAERLAGAPEVIRAAVTDAAFVDDCAPWLDATAVWGRALLATLDGLEARAAGDAVGARRLFDQAHALATQAGQVTTIPGETLPEGPVRVADGVIDDFVAAAPTL